MHLFYKEDLTPVENTLEGEEFRHCALVLRHQVGDTINLTNGKGLMVTAVIKSLLKRHLTYDVLETKELDKKEFYLHLFICPTKNLDRTEWLVEKAGELRVDEITFIIGQNSERRKVNLERLERKAISALKQSKSPWKTAISGPIGFEECLKKSVSHSFIAFLGEKADYITEVIPVKQHIQLFIGPEGDFDVYEIKMAQEKGIKTISLGQSILRTETAGLFACQAVNLINKF